jgi:pyridoxal phosphate enzyme (YggS family)
MVPLQRVIAENLARVTDRIAAAAARAGRRPGDVRLVGVTKYVDVSAAAELLAVGCKDLGESRPQEMWRKAADPRLCGATWHLVGHLQTNKVRRTLPLAALIHSVDSDRLLAAIDEAGASENRNAQVLLEVNCSGESAKHGLTPQSAQQLVSQLDCYARVHVVGLMTMARLEGGAAAAHKDFAKLRQLRDELQPLCPPGVTLGELSMGMSGDFEAAIAEGATIIRIGSALFEGMNQSA